MPTGAPYERKSELRSALNPDSIATIEKERQRAEALHELEAQKLKLNAERVRLCPFHDICRFCCAGYLRSHAYATAHARSLRRGKGIIREESGVCVWPAEADGHGASDLANSNPEVGDAPK